MPMIKCPECGKDISDLANSCPNCGFPLGFESPSINNNNINTSQNHSNYNTVYNNVPYNNTTYNNIPQQKPIKLKESKLSTWAAICAFFTCTIPIAIVLAILDLKKKDKTTKHTGSWFAIIFGSLLAFLLFIGLISGGSGNQTSSGQNESETVIQNNDENVTENKISESSKDDFIASCEEIDYKTLARTPEDYKGRHVKLTVKVTQILQGGIFDGGEYYRVYTNDEYDFWAGDEYLISDKRKDDSTKILQDDIITVYGEFNGTRTMERALTGTKEDVLTINAIYIELIEDDEDVFNEDDEYEGLTTEQKNALKSAKSYLDFSAFSYNGLIEQLEYEKYSHEDAVFAADNCGADWNEQAVEKAKSYLEFSSFSKEGLIEQLEYEGFTYEQAVYGAEQNGY